MYNINNICYFIINNFNVETIHNIIYNNIFNKDDPLNNYYLTIENNIITFSKNITDDCYWMIEKSNETDIYYIKNKNIGKNSVQYLGCPNIDDCVYQYTSKNIFTRWRIKLYENNIYKIDYVGSKFNKSDISLIIARYNENIDWLLPYNDISIIYNKSSEEIKNFKNIKNIENIGREGHTYLYHIINNYNNLTNYNIFLQGGPFDHNETLLYGIDNYFNFLDIQPLGKQWLLEHNIPTEEILLENQTITNYGLKYMKIKIDGNLRIENLNDPGIEILNKNIINIYNIKNSCVLECFLKNAKFPIINNLNDVSFTYSALFSINKFHILKYDIDIYNNLLSELLRSSDQGGVQGYILERLWLYIFENAIYYDKNNPYISLTKTELVTKDDISLTKTELVTKDDISLTKTELVSIENKKNKVKLITKNNKSTKLESITDDESTPKIKLIIKEESTKKNKNEKIVNKNKPINSLPVRSKIPLDIPNMICNNNKSNIKKNIKPIIKKRNNKNQITLEEHRSLEV
jgi:hypothetical protein